MKWNQRQEEKDYTKFYIFIEFYFISFGII